MRRSRNRFTKISDGRVLFGKKTKILCQRTKRFRLSDGVLWFSQLAVGTSLTPRDNYTAAV